MGWDAAHRDRAAAGTPSCEQRLLAGAGVGGRIKVRPEDFLVDEQPLYQPCGEGEHLYLRIEKRGASHAELLSHLRRHFRVRQEAIGFAGMKDKVGVTQQTVSIHLHDDPPSLELAHEGLNILWAARHRNKLRRGHLAGNRFSIRIREVDPLKAPQVIRAVRELQSRGAPNSFGPQRLGYRRNNHILGLMLMRRQWQAALDELLGTRGSPFPEYQRERREMYERFEYASALAQWTAADRAESMAMRALCRGKKGKDAVFSIDGAQRGFFINAWQSVVFNRVLDERIRRGAFDVLLPGDLAWNHRVRKVFDVDDEPVDDADLTNRLRELDISPSGPLWGPKMRRARAVVDEMEIDALRAAGVELSELTEMRGLPDGDRRPIRVRVQHPEVDSGLDEHGPYIRVAFDLPPGAYATVVLRELMGDESEDDEEVEP